MKNELQLFNNVELGLQTRAILNDDGSISVNAEDTAIGFGWTTVATSGNEVIRWARMNNYCRELGFPKMLGKDDYIPESLYYLLGMKANNEKAQKYQKWLAIEVLPKLRKTGTYSMKTNQKTDRNQIMLMNAKTRMANTYLKLANVDTLSSEYKDILVSKASQILSGEDIIPLPKSTQRTYSAKEIGDMFNISANKVGRIANDNNLKTKEYGEYYRDKSKYSNKEVDTWVYFDTVIPVIAKLLGVEVV